MCICRSTRQSAGSTLLTLALALGTVLLERACDARAATVVDDAPFPVSTADAQDVRPDALADLDALVDGFVENDEIVGAELLVIQRGRTVHHAAYGWSDRERERPMTTGSVFCVRSMTKPLVGTAILMLVEEGRLDLGDPAARFLPSFDVEGSRAITVEHLLRHESGLPMSLLAGRDLHELDEAGGIRAVADLGGGYELAFAPGTSFSYSDQGTDTLTAIIEVVTGVPAATFIENRILAPLAMDESVTVFEASDPLRARGTSKYVGTRGSWTRFWTPEDDALFPFFLGSQGLYTTTTDYARFLANWSRGVGDPDRDRTGPMVEPLLERASIERALAPSPHARFGGAAFPGLRGGYGMLMQTWTDDREASRAGAPVVFGHSGSDGTYAWAFPEQDALVLYFTQSRGNSTGPRVERALATLFLDAEPVRPEARADAAPSAAEARAYLGYYREDADDTYRAIILDDGELALEILGAQVVPLDRVGKDRFALRPNPTKVLVFDRNAAGTVTSFSIGDHREFRFDPPTDGPSAEELAARVAARHRIDRLDRIGPIRTSGSLEIERFGMSGTTTTTLAWPNRYRTDSVVGAETESVASDGIDVFTASRLKPAGPLAREVAAPLLLDSPLTRLGDWRTWHDDLRVVQRLRRGDRRIHLVRTGGTESAARTYFVDDDGRVVRVSAMTHADGVGRMGQTITFDDEREVSGMLIPHRLVTQLAHPVVGRLVVEVRIESVELGGTAVADVPNHDLDAFFQLRE